MARERSLVFDLTGGVDRRSDPLTGPSNKLLDVVNLLPRSPMGAQVIRTKTNTTKSASGAVDTAPLTRTSGALNLITRATSSYVEALAAAAMPSSPDDVKFGSATLHQMAPYRGKLAIAQQGTRLQMLDMEGAKCKTLSNAPKGGLVAEYKTLLICGGDTSDDDSAPTITVPLSGLSLPPATDVILAQGTCNVTFNATPVTGTIIDTTGRSGVFTSCVGKIIIVENRGFMITAKSTTTLTDDTVTVTGYNGEPATVTGAPYSVYTSAPLIALPAALEMGTVYLFNKSGAMPLRIFNLSTEPITISNVNPKGAEVIVTDLPTMPHTIPGGGSLSFNVIYTPQSQGDCNASIVIDHDFYAVPSLVVNVHCVGSIRQVLASPSAVDFGAWLAGQTSPAVRLQITNPLKDAVTLLHGSFSLTDDVFTGTQFAVTEVKDSDGNDLTSTYASVDITLLPGKSLNIKLTLTIPASPTATFSGSFAYKRTVPAKPFRIWYSFPGDETTWDRDNDWIDFSGDSLAGGSLRCITPYDDAVIVHRDASIWQVVPGGLGGSFRAIQMALGEGVGAFGPQAVCTGGGAVWWAAKAGIYSLVGQTMTRISDPIEDVIRALATSDYANVRACFYSNMLWVSLPATSTYAAAVWVYEPQTATWWIVSEAPTAMACDKGATRKEALYAFLAAGALYKLDDAFAAAQAFSFKTRLLAAGDPSTLKQVLSADLMLSDPTMVSSITMYANNGAIAAAAQYKTVAAAQLYGTAYYDSGTLILTTGPHGYRTGALVGGVLNIAGTTKTISANDESTLTVGSVISGLPSGYYTFRVVGMAVTPPTPPLGVLKAFFPQGAVGSHFSVSVVGVSVGTAANDVTGFSLDVSHICKEAEDPASRF